MRRDYMNVAKRDYKQEQINSAIDTIEWEPFRTNNLPMSQGEAIKAIVRECGVPLSKITRMSLHGGISNGKNAHHGFYGLDVEYKNARVQIYIADNGCETMVCACDVWEVECIK